MTICSENWGAWPPIVPMATPVVGKLCFKQNKGVSSHRSSNHKQKRHFIGFQTKSPRTFARENAETWICQFLHCFLPQTCVTVIWDGKWTGQTKQPTQFAKANHTRFPRHARKQRKAQQAKTNGVTHHAVKTLQVKPNKCTQGRWHTWRADVGVFATSRLKQQNRHISTLQSLRMPGSAWYREVSSTEWECLLWRFGGRTAGNKMINGPRVWLMIHSDPRSTRKFETTQL